MIANTVVIIGYLCVALIMARYLRLTPAAVAAGCTFFVTSAVSRLLAVTGYEHTPGSIVNHIIQAAAVAAFVVAFYRQLKRASLLLREAERLRRPAEGSEPWPPPPSQNSPTTS